MILASASPRRKELLRKVVPHFQVLPMKISEIPDENLNADEQILQIARRKAGAAVAMIPDFGAAPVVILSADTEVVLDGKLLGKPSSTEDAILTLSRLSARAHDVKTAITLIVGPSGEEISHLETTRITFRPLSRDEISRYAETGDPLDKAGSYGIQGGARSFVEKIEGDFDNVVGLPTKVLESVIRSRGWVFQP